jgi:acyl dehydratase
MVSAQLKVGDRVGPFECRFDVAFIRGMAAATRDTNPRYLDGSAVPPTAIATQIWQAQTAGMSALIPAEIREAATAGVHGEHDVVLHRPIIPGETLQTFVEAYGARPSRSNLRVVLRYLSVDGNDEPVAEQWWTTVYFGTTCAPVGSDAPDHAFPDAAREHPGPEHVIGIDEAMARRYADVSGDYSAHHFDVEAARRSGFDSLFLHGLCTMALCAQAIVETTPAKDPRQVRRLAVRFASPAFLGQDLHVQTYAAGAGRVAFEATSAGAKVISNGRAELAH